MLTVKNLIKTYAPRAGAPKPANAINDVSFEVKTGAFFTLLGPSGCGKTTTLQCIAGLETPTSGRIEIAGKAVFCSSQKLLVPSNQRNLGMIFQSYAIWPHMSVFDNVAFPLVHGGRKVSAEDLKRRVMAALEMVKLADYAHRPSPHLSGGQQQRVALARALVHEPALLLLDEPLSNLDAKLRDTMRVELRQLVKSLGITTIFVTHDQIEAMAMSDDILLMRAGNIVQQGAPRDMFLRPQSVFAADFMGRSNVIPGRVSALQGRAAEITSAIGQISCTLPGGVGIGDALCVVIRPHAVLAVDDFSTERQNVFSGQITQLEFLGDVVEAEITIAGAPIRCMLDPYRPWSLGQTLRVALRPERCVVVPPADAKFTFAAPTPEREPVALRSVS